MLRFYYKWLFETAIYKGDWQNDSKLILLYKNVHKYNDMELRRMTNPKEDAKDYKKDKTSA